MLIRYQSVLVNVLAKDIRGPEGCVDSNPEATYDYLEIIWIFAELAGDQEISRVRAMYITYVRQD